MYNKRPKGILTKLWENLKWNNSLTARYLAEEVKKGIGALPRDYFEIWEEIQGDHIFEKLNSLSFPRYFKLFHWATQERKTRWVYFCWRSCHIIFIFPEFSRFFLQKFKFPSVFPEIFTIFQIPWVFQVFHVFQVCGHPEIFQSQVWGKDSLRVTKLSCEERHGHSLRDSILPVSTCNLNHCRALYRFPNKSYDENRFWRKFNVIGRYCFSGSFSYSLTHSKLFHNSVWHTEYGRGHKVRDYSLAWNFTFCTFTELLLHSIENPLIIGQISIPWTSWQILLSAWLHVKEEEWLNKKAHYSLLLLLIQPYSIDIKFVRSFSVWRSLSWSEGFLEME